MPANPTKDKTGDEAFLSRWSRRKRTDDAIVEDTPANLPSDTPPETAAEQELTDEELLAELDLPEPEGMKAGDDFSAFMQARVPERLRRRALRSLWLSNPTLANLDELVDYGEDFTDAATVVENMQTVYEVGKGIAEKWKAQVAALAEDSDQDDIGDTETLDPVPRQEQEPAPEPITIASAQPESQPPAPIQTAQPDMPPTPRHMRFAFD